MKSNSTLYGQEMSNFKAEGLELKTMTYFSHNKLGTYVFLDNKGFFTIIKKESLYDSNPKIQNKHTFIFTHRIFSGFSEIQLVKQQMYLTLFTNKDKIGFVRTFDGKLSNSHCSLNGTDIVSIDFDQFLKGRFYVATQNGEINVLQATSSKKTDIRCDLIGKIHGNPESSQQLIKLKQMLLSYEDTGKFHVYNTTKIKNTQFGLDFSEVVPIPYTPDYQTITEKVNGTLEMIESPTASGHELLLRIPGTQDRLIVIEVINTDFKGEPWFMSYLSDKGLVFTV